MFISRIGRLLVAVVLAVAAPAGAASPVAASQAASSVAERQLDWVLDASHRVPISEAEQREHLSSAFLDAIKGPDAFNAVLAQFGPQTLRHLLNRAPAQVQAITDGPSGGLLITVAVDGSGLVSLLRFAPYAPTPRSWAELRARLAVLAPRASFVAAVIEPRSGCRPVHAVDAEAARPLGSVFKLYVLGALGQAVADRRASWDQRLAIREEWKSMPSGVLQDAPAGTVLTLRQYANYMISISDNTATDHLIHLLGRPAVQGQLVRFGNRAAWANLPFLSTREFFTLKGHSYPALADGYLSLPRPLRAAVLPALGRVPRSEIDPWTEPRKIDQIEWFGSANDVCRAYAGLWRQHSRPGLAPVGDALSIVDGDIGLARTRYPTVWFKGGSEPGVLALGYLARTDGGRVVMAGVLLSDPARPLDDAVVGEAIALARGGLVMAGG